MASLNKVFLMGNLTRDPEVRYTPSGAAVGDLGLAVSRRFKSSDGENREETCFVNITVWGRQAETCAEYLKKGRPVMVEGRLRYEEWEKDGKKNSKIVVVAERVAGDAETLRAKPFYGLYLEPISPLHIETSIAERALFCAEHEIPFTFAPGAVVSSTKMSAAYTLPTSASSGLVSRSALSFSAALFTARPPNMVAREPVV